MVELLTAAPPQTKQRIRHTYKDVMDSYTSSHQSLLPVSQSDNFYKVRDQIQQYEKILRGEFKYKRRENDDRESVARGYNTRLKLAREKLDTIVDQLSSDARPDVSGQIKNITTYLTDLYEIAITKNDYVAQQRKHKTRLRNSIKSADLQLKSVLETYTERRTNQAFARAEIDPQYYSLEKKLALNALSTRYEQQQNSLMLSEQPAVTTQNPIKPALSLEVVTESDGNGALTVSPDGTVARPSIPLTLALPEKFKRSYSMFPDVKPTDAEMGYGAFPTSHRKRKKTLLEKLLRVGKSAAFIATSTIVASAAISSISAYFKMDYDALVAKSDNQTYAVYAAIEPQRVAVTKKLEAEFFKNVTARVAGGFVLLNDHYIVPKVNAAKLTEPTLNIKVAPMNQNYHINPNLKSNAPNLSLADARDITAEVNRVYHESKPRLTQKKAIKTEHKIEAERNLDRIINEFAPSALKFPHNKKWARRLLATQLGLRDDEFTTGPLRNSPVLPKTAESKLSELFTYQAVL